MLAIICLFLPGIVMTRIRVRLLFSERDLKKEIQDYLISIIFLNYLMIVLLIMTGRDLGDLCENLNRYVVFAWKYLSCTLALAAACPYIEKFVRSRVKLSISLSDEIRHFNHWRAAAGIYTIFLFLLNLIRIFDHSFWGDEAYTIKMLDGTVSEMLEVTAADVHLPLYYLIFRAACFVLGSDGYVYHLVSILPYACILVTALTIIWKEFGKEACVILVTLASLMPSAVTYNVEVRMYSWAALFVYLSFLGLYGILIRGRRKDYIFFTICSLGAAYTHYYALVSVAFFYLILMYISVRKKNIVRCAAVYATAVLGYYPWMRILIRTFQTRSKDFWIQDIPSLKNCAAYLFQMAGGGMSLSVVFILSMAAVLLYETGILEINAVEHKNISISLHIRKIRMTDFSTWLTAGAVSILGTIMTGVLVSAVFRPLFILRYLYPVSIVAWLMLAVCIARLRYRVFYAIGIVVFILNFALPEYRAVYVKEKAESADLEVVLEATKSQIGKDDMILTNISHFQFTLSDYYYPGITHQMISLDSFDEMEGGIQYWLFLEEGSLEAVVEQEEADLGLEEIIVNRNFGHYRISVYKVTDLKKAGQLLERKGNEKEAY